MIDAVIYGMIPNAKNREPAQIAATEQIDKSPATEPFVPASKNCGQAPVAVDPRRRDVGPPMRYTTASRPSVNSTRLLRRVGNPEDIRQLRELNLTQGPSNLPPSLGDFFFLRRPSKNLCACTVIARLQFAVGRGFLNRPCPSIPPRPPPFFSTSGVISGPRPERCQPVQVSRRRIPSRKMFGGNRALRATRAVANGHLAGPSKPADQTRTRTGTTAPCGPRVEVFAPCRIPSPRPTRSSLLR